MKKIIENLIVQNVLAVRVIYNFIGYICQMTGDRKKRMIRLLRFSAKVVRKNTIMREIKEAII